MNSTASNPDWVALSVDLEPNLDGSLTQVEEAMRWFDDLVSTSTIYVTKKIAISFPDLINMLAENHEIGVHVHPREFGYEHDRLARLDSVQQKNLIRETRTSVANAADIPEDEVISFRAGRHSVDQETWRILAEDGFETDASINVQYEEEVPQRLRRKRGTFRLPNGLIEIPVSWADPPLLSRTGLWSLPQRTVTATSSTIRIDRRGCTGYNVFNWLISNLNANLSTYLHPHDATDYHENLENNGKIFRERFEKLIHNLECKQVTAAQIAESM